MSVSLAKGGNVSLSKAAPDLTQVRIGLGWQAHSAAGVSRASGVEFDLDASALLCSAGRVPGDEYFVFYNNLRSPDGSVEHGGDHLTGSGSGDDEVIDVNLELVPASVDRVVFAVSIYEAEARAQSFGQIGRAYIRVVNRAGGREIARYDLTGEASTETAVVFGELYRHHGEWKFRAVGRGYPSGLRGIALELGVNVQ